MFSRPHWTIKIYLSSLYNWEELTLMTSTRDDSLKVDWSHQYSLISFFQINWQMIINSSRILTFISIYLSIRKLRTCSKEIQTRNVNLIEDNRIKWWCPIRFLMTKLNLFFAKTASRYSSIMNYWLIRMSNNKMPWIILKNFSTWNWVKKIMQLVEMIRIASGH